MKRGIEWSLKYHTFKALWAETIPHGHIESVREPEHISLLGSTNWTSSAHCFSVYFVLSSVCLYIECLFAKSPYYGLQQNPNVDQSPLAAGFVNAYPLSMGNVAGQEQNSTGPDECSVGLARQKAIETQETIYKKGDTAARCQAAEAGNDEFLVELIRRYPDFLYKVNQSKHSIFHIAVLHRYVRVFNLMHELVGVKELIATYIDKDGNNMLHLAAKLSPQNQLNSIPGAALQMQREVLWYKNKAGHTPYDIFLAEHENLMKEGEKLMKQTAKSCMLVTMLIATVVFTTAFTVPGGYNNNNGAPILQNEKVFMVFPISEAVATLSSFTSMLMFLSILTSRYTEKDFLNSLPFWLLIGVGALFISIVAMMVAFCTCLLSYEHGLVAATALLAFFASVPIMFIILKYELLATVLRCTYGCRWLFRSNNRLFS
ncbi:hypothetical protein Sango_1429000 [Sesamum angolense]|uniref:PGG domain-containing protein n=1 Tax=Sesamum angolense TaxID=2727404 RepID=A0AAE1WTZ7_9LAMI|nr:hypothetical protein Sango_1429000 [Sesamum angolense]